MKRLICFALAILFSMQLCSCKQEKEKIQKPVNFYYRNSETSYGSERGVISPQVAESEGIDNQIDILNKYLRGATDTSHVATFPASTKLLELTVIENTAYLKMNDALARLTGMELTVACACITLTVMDLTGVSNVNIRTSNEPLDGSESINMNLENVMLLDLYTPETTQE